MRFLRKISVNYTKNPQKNRIKSRIIYATKPFTFIKHYRKTFIFIFLIVFFLLFGIIIPRIFIKDNKDISGREADCAKFESWIVFDNPIERILTVKMAATNKEKGKIYVTVYTIFGIKYATIEAYCDDNFNNGANLIQRKIEF